MEDHYESLVRLEEMTMLVGRLFRESCRGFFGPEVPLGIGHYWVSFDHVSVVLVIPTFPCDVVWRYGGRFLCCNDSPDHPPLQQAFHREAEIPHSTWREWIGKGYLAIGRCRRLPAQRVAVSRKSALQNRTGRDGLKRSQWLSSCQVVIKSTVGQYGRKEILKRAVF